MYSAAAPAGKAAAGATGGAAGGGGTAAKGGAADKKGAKKKVKEGKLGVTVTQGPTGFNVGEPVPISIFKDQKDPIIGDDAAYPAWLWTDVLDQPSVKQILRMKKQGKEVSYELQRRLKKLQRKVRFVLLACANWNGFRCEQ